MTPEDTQHLEYVGALADVCRAKGIRALEIGRVKMTLGDINAPLKAGEKVDDGEMCRCGHPTHDHGPLCLHGCDPAKCLKAET